MALTDEQQELLELRQDVERLAGINLDLAAENERLRKDGIVAKLDSLDFEGTATLVTLQVPHETRWSGGEYLIKRVDG